MFERFTEESKQVIACTQDEAFNLKHNYIGTEHLLLALLREKGIAAHVLQSVNLTYKETHDLVDVTVYRGERLGEVDETEAKAPLSFSPRLKRVLTLSLFEALQLGHSHIGTEHLLLGLLKEETAMGTRILERQAINLSRVRRITLQQIQTVNVGLREENIKLRERVGELEDHIKQATKQLYDGLDMFDHDMRFYAENAIGVLGKAALPSGEKQENQEEDSDFGG